jgi:ketosteroid isomerase-like protein
VNLLTGGLLACPAVASAEADSSPARGVTYIGKQTIREWYERWSYQFPSARFTLKDVAVANIFDFRGDNVIATHWEVDAVNREGLSIQNTGMTLITVKKGKVIRAQEFIFDIGEKFRAAWGDVSALHANDA